MLENFKQALKTWPEDAKTENVSLPEDQKYIISSILSKSKLMQDYSSRLETVDPDEDDLYDTAYTDSHFVAGFGQIIKSEKIYHLGQLAELISDLARYFSSYSNFSMLYLHGLILDKLNQVCAELIKGKPIKTDISDVVSECVIYLNEPLSQALDHERAKREERANLELSIRPESPQTAALVPLTESSTVELQIEAEEPEEIKIPPEKIGLISDFCEEVWESLQASENLLIELENSPSSKDLINELFRAVHTVKGGSRLLEIKKIEKISHELETVLDQVRSDRKTLTPSLIDLALACIKRIHNITHEVASRGPINTKVNDLIAFLKSGSDANVTFPTNVEIGIQKPVQADISPDGKQSPKNIENPKPSNVVREDSIRVSADKLDSVLNASSEVYITRIRLENDQKHLTDAINRMHEDIQGLGKELDKRLTKSSADAANEKGSHGSQRKVGEGELKYFEHNELTEPLLGTQSDLLIGVERLSIQNKNIQKNIEDLEVLSSRLQSGAMNFRMVPISNLFNRFPAQVRDIARQIGKRVELRISGAETELDKILINQLADPLLHLIRNSIDHGIENPQTRAEMKKGEVGQIDLRAYYLGSNAIIEIEDDGKGIDANVILKKAIEKGLIADGQRTDILEKEIFDFIFEPGFSSAEEVTELSGRGVGMDVVKTSISRMQGSIKVQSKVNSGTVVTLRLPLTLAVVGILLVSENGYEFAFPILNVDEVIHINLTKDIKRINETLVYNFRSELVPVNYLSDFLDYPKNPKQTGDNFLLILNDGETKIGVIVDAVLGQQNVLLKQLGSLIETAPFVIGCTILSNSKLVLILNVLELTQDNTKAETAMVYEKIERGDQVELQRSSANILIVDDSGIQRKRICSFLEINGYKTLQASDGYEAINLAKDEKVNAFCIDIQMPLMDGYELIDRLRSQIEHKSTPIFVISGVHMNKDNAVSLLNEKKIQNFYEKPVDLESLLADLDEHCQINRNENFLELV
tara:strand:+ start:3869 stop:6829 length:2961 start_codon:yes stop_codon:yes gene_type:complete